MNRHPYCKNGISLILCCMLLLSALFTAPITVSAETGDVASFDFDTPAAVTTGTAGVSYTAFQNGSAGYCFADNTTSGPQCLSYTLSLTAGVTYTAEYDFYLLKKSTDSSGCLLAEHAHENDGTVFAETYPNNADYNLYQWYHKTFSFTSAVTENGWFNLYTYGGSRVIFDNITVKAGTSAVFTHNFDTAADAPTASYYSRITAAAAVSKLAAIRNNSEGLLYMDAGAVTDDLNLSVPNTGISYTHTIGKTYQVAFDYRVLQQNTAANQFAILNNGTAVSTYTSTTVTDTAWHTATLTFKATASTFVLCVYGSAVVEFDNLVISETYDAAQVATLSAVTRISNGEQYVDVTYNTGASAKSFAYNINYDPDMLTYVSTAKGTDLSGFGTSVSAVKTDHDAVEKLVVDATSGEQKIKVNFDVPAGYSFTNTTGAAASANPNPVYFNIVARYTGTTTDIHGYELDFDINGSRYYPAQYYIDLDSAGTAGEWVSYGNVTHSAQPSATGENYFEITVSKGITVEFQSITLYNGWTSSDTVLDSFVYAGDNAAQAAYSSIDVTAKAYAKKTGNIAVSTFKVADGVIGETDLGLTMSDAAMHTVGTTVAINAAADRVCAQKLTNGMRFATTLPVDASGEYFTVGKTVVRPASKGFVVALGYHAAADMTIDSDPYVLNIPVTDTENADAVGNRYTLAVSGKSFEENTHIAARFYISYYSGGTLKYAYSDICSVTRSALETVDSDKWLVPTANGDAVTVSIDNTVAASTGFMGANAIAQGYIYNNGYTTSQISTELSRMQEMDINLVRSYFDQTFNLQYNATADTLTYVTTRDRLTALKKWLQTMKDQNIQVALNMSWSISDIFEQGYTCYDGWSSANAGAIPNAFNQYYKAGHTVEEVTAEYGKWVAQSLKYLINDCGFTNITHIIMFTEPQSSYWDKYINMISAVDVALKNAGIRTAVKMVGPNILIGDTAALGSVSADMAKFDAIRDYVDVYSFHFYAPHWPAASGSSSTDDASTDNYAEYVNYFTTFVNYAKACGKEYWLDEFNYSPGSAGIAAAQENALQGTQYAQTLIAAMNSGVQNAMLWQLFEIKWPTRSDTGNEFENGIHAIGLAPSLTESATPYAAYYAYGLLSKYLGDGNATVYAGTGADGVYTAMVQNSDGTVSIIAVNTNNTAKQVTVNLSATLGGKTLYRHAYNPATVNPDSAAVLPTASLYMDNLTTSVTDILAAGEVVVYTDMGSEIQSFQTELINRPTAFQLGGEVTEVMVKDSVLNKGNRAGIASVMNTLKNGGAVKITFIGGSVTEGDFAEPKSENCYAAKLISMLKSAYPQAQIEWVNAGIDATDSYIGVHRAAEQVLTENPDLVLVDFAVDDDGGSIDNAAFESLLQMLWNSAGNPAVLCLATAFYDTASDTLLNVQNVEYQIAQKYEIPMLSYKNMLEPLLETGALEWSDIGFDTVHPNNAGHDLIAKMIYAYLRDIANTRIFDIKPDFSEISDRVTTYINANWLTPNNSNPTIYSSKFTKNKTTVLHNIQGYWTSNSASTGYMLFNNVSAQYIGICYEAVGDSSACNLLIYVDGTLVKTINPNESAGHPVGVQVYAGSKTGTHTVKIKTSGTGTARVFAVLTA